MRRVRNNINFSFDWIKGLKIFVSIRSKRSVFIYLIIYPKGFLDLNLPFGERKRKSRLIYFKFCPFSYRFFKLLMLKFSSQAFCSFFSNCLYSAIKIVKGAWLASDMKKGKTQVNPSRLWLDLLLSTATEEEKLVIPNSQIRLLGKEFGKRIRQKRIKIQKLQPRPLVFCVRFPLKNRQFRLIGDFKNFGQHKNFSFLEGL